ncbi:MAG TPA: hypothetical protein VNN72_17580 [Polyangiaceae bacterium]|nr:hypothetical protein [Polyangiaceae bacterium]
MTVWGCSSLPPPSEGDDDDSTSGSGNKGQGGASSFAGSSGNGSLGGTGAGTCTAPQQTCNGVCTNVLSDPMHCGNCATSCGAAFCSNGTCKTACDAGLDTCGNACVNTHGSDVNNCGACGMRCAATQACNAGICTTPSAGGASGAGGSSGGASGGQPPVGGMAGQGQGGTIAAGGVGATAGSGAGGAAGGSTGANPPGYWTYQTMHGCAWTGIDTVSGTTTTVTPKDFTMNHAADAPYCVKGTVNADYESVALLGFNLAQPAEGANCTYDPAAATAAGPPELAMTGMGLAISFSKTTASTLRVQMQGQDGATNGAHRWCTTITDAAGPVFIPYSAFTTECWEGGTPVKYNNEKISAVVFLVPGNTAASPYDFCINGFAMGTSVADAPAGGSSGPLMGTIGGPGSTDLDFQRVKVKKDGHSYIIQNNNWGNPSGTDQKISYVDNSFTITSPTGSGNSSGAPASFPSIFIGANGDTQNGTFSTTSDDHLPKKVSDITSVTTSFRHNVSGGGMNATYDVWFANSPPSARYDDGINGFVMIWLYDPPNAQPIGSSSRTATIAGKAFNVWSGTRGGGGSNSNAPVVSYVAQAATTSMTNFNLKDFITDAGNGISGMYLTDVFAGFEIWTGSDSNGKSVQEFTAVVAP